MTLLRVLLSDVELELSNGFIPHVIKNSKFLRLLHWVRAVMNKLLVING